MLYAACGKLTGGAVCAPCWSGQQSACDLLNCATDVSTQISKVAAHLADLHGDDVHPERAEHAALDQQIRDDQARVARERRLNEARQDALARESAAQHLQVREPRAHSTFGRCSFDPTIHCRSSRDAAPRSAATADTFLIAIAIAAVIVIVSAPAVATTAAGAAGAAVAAVCVIAAVSYVVGTSTSALWRLQCCFTVYIYTTLLGSVLRATMAPNVLKLKVGHADTQWRNSPGTPLALNILCSNRMCALTVLQAAVLCCKLLCWAGNTGWRHTPGDGGAPGCA